MLCIRDSSGRGLSHTYLRIFPGDRVGIQFFVLGICHFHILETIPIQDDIWHRISTEQNYHFPLLCIDLVNKFAGTHEVTSTKKKIKKKEKGKENRQSVDIFGGNRNLLS